MAVEINAVKAIAKEHKTLDKHTPMMQQRLCLWDLNRKLKTYAKSYA